MPSGLTWMVFLPFLSLTITACGGTAKDVNATVEADTVESLTVTPYQIIMNRIRQLMTQQTSAKLFQQAQNIIPGGVNSPVRAFNGVGGEPCFIETIL